MVDAGAAVTIADRELTSARLAHDVATLLADPSRLDGMGRAAQALARPDAARAVARELLLAARS
jgi:UDP-N-acetylglucosamine--N-acetylmuramyl-(pentapeptide) pyrophosphoryl-undecaprenol N-acetylglucosamine transferase